MQTRDEETHTLTQKNTNTSQHHEALLDPSLISRLGFIRKVYSILCVQLAFSALFAIVSLNTPALRDFQAEDVVVLILCCITAVVIMCMLFCCKNNARQTPKNYILLSIFTICEAYCVSAACCQVVVLFSNGVDLVIMALVMTVTITVGLTIYACTTKQDFTICVGILWALSICLLLFGIFLFFTNNPVLHILYCVLSIFFYSIYLIVDTQLVVGGQRYELQKDDYILGAIILYIDIIMLFLELLKLLVLLFGKK